MQGSGERQLAVSGNALDHTAIGAGLLGRMDAGQWLETASSQWQHLRPHGHRGRPSREDGCRAVVRDS